MKFSTTIILSSIAGAAAFTAPAASTVTKTTVLRMSDATADEPTEEAPATPEPVLPKMSQALPWMERPAALDGSLVGDVGFDPMGFAKTKEDLINYREAEIKHGRLAMLAAAGWPLSELFDRKLASWINMQPLVDANDRAPSVLNGGLGKVSPVYWVACLAAAAAVDFYGISRARKGEASFPGDLGIDIGLYPKDKAGQERMQLAELKNGRLAMIAITGFALQEFVTKFGVVDETPVFFKPFSTVIHEYANSGYVVPN